jgi:hypothetical protein
LVSELTDLLSAGLHKTGNLKGGPTDEINIKLDAVFKSIELQIVEIIIVFAAAINGFSSS